VNLGDCYHAIPDANDDDDGDLLLVPAFHPSRLRVPTPFNTRPVLTLAHHTTCRDDKPGGGHALLASNRARWPNNIQDPVHTYLGRYSTCGHCWYQHFDITEPSAPFHDEYSGVDRRGQCVQTLYHPTPDKQITRPSRALVRQLGDRRSAEPRLLVPWGAHCLLRVSHRLASA
jgi:hypothetical protein